MSTLKDFWKRIDAMAEEQRIKIPVWCVRVQDAPSSSYTLYRMMTREEAVEKFKSQWVENTGIPFPMSSVVSCTPATDRQIEEHRRWEEKKPRPMSGRDYPESPRLRMEKI